MLSVIVMRGLPGSGKSTYAYELMKKEPGRFVRVNKDDIRSMLHNNVWSRENEEITRQAHDNAILVALRNGKNLIIDNTNLVPASLRKLHRLLESVGGVKVIEKCFNVSVEEAKRRNALREGKARVPDSAIEGMAKGAGIDRGRILEDREVIYPPRAQQTTLYHGNVELPKAILVDLDGTLATIGDRSPYDASECDTKDILNTPIAECVKAMYAAGYKIIFMSGRQEKDRLPTERFITKHLPNLEHVLFMRATDDSRKDYIIKEELFNAYVRENYNISFAIDDRNSIIDLWRFLGITALQCAEGNF